MARWEEPDFIAGYDQGKAAADEMLNRMTETLLLQSLKYGSMQARGNMAWTILMMTPESTGSLLLAAIARLASNADQESQL